MEQFYSFIWSWLLHLLRWFQEVAWLNTDLCVLYESSLRGQGFNYYLTIIRRTSMIEQSSTWQWNEGKKTFFNRKRSPGSERGSHLLQLSGRWKKDEREMEHGETTNNKLDKTNSNREKTKAENREWRCIRVCPIAAWTKAAQLRDDPALKISFNQYWMF